MSLKRRTQTLFALLLATLSLAFPASALAQPVTTTGQAGGIGPAPQLKYGPKAAQVNKAARHYQVSFWIMWGIAGAESGWGSVGSNLFGLLDAAGGVDISSWKYASLQAAKTMDGLHDGLGSWSEAMGQYSGHNYGLDHVRAMYDQQKPNI